MPETNRDNLPICPSGEHKDKYCQCAACRVIGLCVSPGEDGFDFACSPCLGPVKDCDPLEGLNEDIED